MFAFFLQIIVSVVLAFLTYLLAPKPKEQQ